MAESHPVDTTPSAAAMLQELLRRTHLSSPHDLGVAVAEEARRMGARDVVIYLIDYEQRTLIPVPSPDSAGRGQMTVHGTVAGRAFASTSIVDVEASGGRRLWLPLLD